MLVAKKCEVVIINTQMKLKKKIKRQYQSNIHSNYGPRPMKLHKGMNLLAQSKNLYPRSLHWGMGQRYGKTKVAPM